MELHFSSRIVRAKNTWKSSAAAIKQIRKGEFSFLRRKSNRLFVSIAKNLVRICLVEKLKSLMATNCFHLASTSSNKRSQRKKQCPFHGRKEQVKLGGRRKLICKFLPWIPTVCYFYQSVFLWFSRGRKLHRAGVPLIHA